MKEKNSKFGKDLDKHTQRIALKLKSPLVITFALDPNSLYAEMAAFGVDTSINWRLKDSAFAALQATYEAWIEESMNEIKSALKKGVLT